MLLYCVIPEGRSSPTVFATAVAAVLVVPDVFGFCRALPKRARKPGEAQLPVPWSREA